MGNLIRADIFRLRKGATIRNTVLGVLVTILLIGFTMILADTLTDEPVISESTAESQRADGVGVVTNDILAVTSGASFATEMQAQNVMALFILPLFIAVFADDYNNGAYRNLLSFETNRKKIYAAKLVLSFLLTLALLVLYHLLSVLVGGVLFGFGGVFSLQYWLRTFISILLMSPLYLAYLSVGHMVTAITRKSSSTIAIYFLVILLWSTAVMLLASFIPGMEWLTLFDFLSGISFLAYYWALPTWGIFSYIGLALGFTVVTSAIGLRRYVTADMP